MNRKERDMKHRWIGCIVRLTLAMGSQAAVVATVEDSGIVADDLVNQGPHIFQF